MTAVPGGTETSTYRYLITAMSKVTNTLTTRETQNKTVMGYDFTSGLGRELRQIACLISVNTPRSEY